MGSNDEGWEMVWNGGMGWRGIDCVDGGHCTGRKTTSLCDRRHGHDCAHL